MQHIKLFEDWQANDFQSYLTEEAAAPWNPRAKANSIFDAIDGCQTDEEALEKAFNSIINRAEWIEIIKAYGTREVTCWLTPDTKGDIFAGIDSDVDNKDLINKLNGILKSKGVEDALFLYNIDNFFSAETLDKGLHLLGDVASAIADTVEPGSGAVIDFFHTLVYFIQGMLATDINKKIGYGISGLVQFASIFAFGPMQAGAVAVKNQVDGIVKAFMRRTLTPDNARELTVFAVGVSSWITSVLKNITGLLANVMKEVAKLTGDAVKWITKKLGTPNFGERIVRYFTTELPDELNHFLTMLAPLNPSKFGAGSGSQEAYEFIAKTAGKILISNWTTDNAQEVLKK